MMINFSLEKAKHNTIRRESKAVRVEISRTIDLHISKVIIKKELFDSGLIGCNKPGILNYLSLT